MGGDYDDHLHRALQPDRCWHQGSPRRLDAAKKLLADMGGEMKQCYMVMATATLSEFAGRRMMR
jgi:hypothetical protein